MTGKDMLKGIQDLDAALIEEAEFETFKRSRAGLSGGRKLLVLLAAALAVGSMIAAAAYTRWSATMQFGSYGGAQPSEEIKKQAEKTGLSMIPTGTDDGGQETVSATDNGVTITLAQTVMDQNGGKAIFRTQGLELDEGQSPWAWYDYTIDGKDWTQLGISGGSQFFNGTTQDEAGNWIYVKNGEPVSGGYDYQLSDGSIEFSCDFSWEGKDVFGKEMVFTFTGLGITGEKFEDEDIMTTPGKWELRWTLQGSTEEPKKWTPNAKIGHWNLTLVEAEIGQYSMKLTYRLGDEYADVMDFNKREGWNPTPAGIRLKDGTDIQNPSGSGSGGWDAENHLFTETLGSLGTVLDPEQIAGLYFYAGYDLNEEGFRVEKPYYYIPLE